MSNFKKHLISDKVSIREALDRLNKLAKDAIIFVVNDEQQLVGSLTDGDVRRGLLRGVQIDNLVTDIIQKDPKFITKGDADIQKILDLRDNNFRILPVIDKNKKIVKIVNFRTLKSYLPIDAVVMAGGRGERLKPLTDHTPKPLLKIGNKPIIEHNMDRLISFGVDDFWISVRYLGEQIEDYFKDGSAKDVQIEYIWEDEPLGTIGAVSKVNNFKHDHILVTNSDLLTTLDYEQFYLEHIKNDADISVVTIPYSISIPYAVLETEKNIIKGFEEKPTYTYYSNGGIYLIKKSIIEQIPSNSFFNATDLLEKVIKENGKVCSFPLRGYWLDIGKMPDYQKAQEDIETLDL